MDVNFVQAQMSYAHFLQLQQQQQTMVTTTAPSNPYAQIVSNISKEIPAESASDITKAPILYNKAKPKTPPPIIGPIAPPKPQQEAELAPITKVEEKEEEPLPPAAPKIDKPLLSIAQYGSDSESDSNDDTIDRKLPKPTSPPPIEVKPVKIPPEETKLVIDKMAAYVLKNGKDFESIVRAKNDPRFEFLNEDHEFNAYYKQELGETVEDEENNLKKLISKNLVEYSMLFITDILCFSTRLFFYKKAKGRIS